MTATKMTLEEIRVAGLRALSRELEAAGLVRFLQQFETGSGDYSRDGTTGSVRMQWRVL